MYLDQTLKRPMKMPSRASSGAQGSGLFRVGQSAAFMQIVVIVFPRCGPDLPFFRLNRINTNQSAHGLPSISLNAGAGLMRYC
jgi:hypothetical protein